MDFNSFNIDNLCFSWGAGASPWGTGMSKRFEAQSIGDNLIEIFGVTGVAHMVRLLLCVVMFQSNDRFI